MGFLNILGIHRTGIGMAQSRGIVFAEYANEFFMKVIVCGDDRARHPLSIGFATEIDFLLQPLVNVRMLPSLFEFLFMIQLDFRYEQPRDSTRLRMSLLVVRLCARGGRGGFGCGG